MNFKRIIFSLLTICSLSGFADDLDVDGTNTSICNTICMSENVAKQHGTVDVSKPAIAKYAISALMGKPASDMKVKTQGTIYIVSYIRTNDGEHFSYKIKFAGNNIIWGNADGRWRDGVADEKLSFSAKKSNVFIHVKYSDGSAETKKY